MITVKKIALGFVIGALVCGAIGVFASYSSYTTKDNPYPVTLDGREIKIEGYNIEGNTYFKLRDIADAVGGFTVDFKDNKIVLTTGGGDTPLSAAPQTAAAPSDGDIGLEKAKEIALNKAGLTENDVVFAKTLREIDDGILQYEIEFLKDNTEYSADVRASDGEIIKWDIDTERAPAAPASGDIDVEKAKEIAAAKAGYGVSDVTFTKQHMDIDNGVRVYEIDFIKDNTEYSADVRASDGTILDWDEDRGITMASPSTAPDESAASGAITADRAKEIALNKAGFDESDVTGLRVKYDRDDGVNKYDVEFRNGRNEYSVEVRASDGEILEYDIDD